jgi:GT2 family glycosyltransferase
MPEPEPSVAIPVRNGGELLERTLAALARQTVGHELLVCDSGSTDDSVQVARAHGARVLNIAPSQFSHGGTRNLLMEQSRGAHVALLTQDAEPADEDWLENLLGAFELDDDVAIAFGPYRPRPDAAPPVRAQLDSWFASLSPDGQEQVERLGPRERALPVLDLMGRRGFFTDANACLARAAWERVPFREVAYAEDRVLAIDMMRAGYAKAFVPAAAVIHSHNHSSLQDLRRSFDEWRGLREVYGWREPASPAHLLRGLRGELRRAHEATIAESVPAEWVTLAAVGHHHAIGRAGALLGSRADRLPASARRMLSLEGRGGFAPLDLDAERSSPPTASPGP